MIIDTFYEQHLEIIFSYMPVWEMFFSMHVLARPYHHQERQNWIKNVEKRHPDLVSDVRRLRAVSGNWLLVIGSDLWETIRQMEIPEALNWLRQMNIIDWGRMVHYYKNSLSIKERDEILDVVKRYYAELYEREEMILRPFLIRLIREETKKCRERGFFRWCTGIHPRLVVGEEEILYMKNRDFSFKKKYIHRAFVTMSTYLAPHLWLYERNGSIEFVKTVEVEQKRDMVPEDLLLVLKSVSDKNRLRIMKELVKGICTTKALAEKMGITEAAVSKHLNILLEAEVVEKQRRGYYIEYELRKTTIDYIPYDLYEWILQ